ncbi:VOC family protein [Streptomyces sp. NPDC001817]|uniref:VOC family protein n=1 Tax=Streptomyces sp. NPDC001817 TaxID=3154398 RepID=UPI003332208E
MEADVRTRFSHGGVEVASIGFLLVAGDEQALAPFRDVQSTVLVDDLDGLQALLTAHGGKIVDGPNRVPTGRNATVRHAGGVVIEYVEHSA